MTTDKGGSCNPSGGEAPGRLLGGLTFRQPGNPRGTHSFASHPCGWFAFVEEPSRPLAGPSRTDRRKNRPERGREQDVASTPSEKTMGHARGFVKGSGFYRPGPRRPGAPRRRGRPCRHPAPGAGQVPPVVFPLRSFVSFVRAAFPLLPGNTMPLEAAPGSCARSFGHASVTSSCLCEPSGFRPQRRRADLYLLGGQTLSGIVPLLRGLPLTQQRFITPEGMRRMSVPNPPSRSPPGPKRRRRNGAGQDGKPRKGPPFWRLLS